ncbi:hypothetical protein [Treponema sp.]|uniref:lactate/malate family dehydrogenase n=1 Tax=Treponema sp. TaxID=166 RepID=UPI0025D80A05|nr:hypothetical protein [Treponema sp.]MBR4321750.1 hypothetical protein [Treponema sp.]
MSLNRRKIAIIGAGHVSSHGGYALISQGLAEEIVYIDVDREKAAAQALDLNDSSTYIHLKRMQSKIIRADEIKHLQELRLQLSQAIMKTKASRLFTVKQI